MMKRIYVSGPYSKGDQVNNMREAVLAYHDLAEAGFAPYCPHLTGFAHFLVPKPYRFWMEQDFAWIPCCHALLRLQGESSGADEEVALARQLGIPVFFDLFSLVKYFNEQAEAEHSETNGAD